MENYTKNRYVIRRGRFGLYFYDTLTKQDLDFNKALELLNAYGYIIETLSKDLRIIDEVK